MTTLYDCSNSILLIGSGRLAKHLLHWNSLLENPNKILAWNRSEELSLLRKLLDESTHIWLAISDSSILSFFESNLKNFAGQVVHFSGALYDPRLVSAHPMMTFPTGLLPDSTYKDIAFGLTGASDLSLAMPGFKNTFFHVAEKDKALYHALCVVAGNFPQLLWNEADQKFSELRVPEKAFQTYITQVLNNYLNLKQKSLTGPIVRKDLTTIEKNEAALTGTKLKAIYHSFAKEFLP